jgi:hypothetical protein
MGAEVRLRKIERNANKLSVSHSFSESNPNLGSYPPFVPHPPLPASKVRLRSTGIKIIVPSDSQHGASDD